MDKIKIQMKVSIIIGIILLGIRSILVELDRIGDFMKGFLMGSSGVLLVCGCILLIYYYVKNKDDIKRNRKTKRAGMYYGFFLIIISGIKLVKMFFWEVPDYVAIPLYFFATAIAIIGIINNRNEKEEDGPL
ncbi:MAG TPA: hypothetical protein VJZ04_07570 [Lachnospiraceae bacterium]|nr:hypothetical protein [Lachnospiraceae bacterium]